jgi:hypothetical protein
MIDFGALALSGCTFLSLHSHKQQVNFSEMPPEIISVSYTNKKCTGNSHQNVI